VKEPNANTEAAVFEHNALASGYLDEGADFPPAWPAVNETRIFAAQVNAASDMLASGNIDGSCYAAGSEQLAAGSACIDAGSMVDPPTYDYDGQLRGAAPDIGSDEF